MAAYSVNPVNQSMERACGLRDGMPRRDHRATGIFFLISRRKLLNQHVCLVNPTLSLRAKQSALLMSAMAWWLMLSDTCNMLNSYQL